MKNTNKEIILIQRGGFFGALINLLRTGGEIAFYTVLGLFTNLKYHFRIWPEGERWWYPPFDDLYVGTFWKFIFFCIKSSFYLLIFAFGGPVVTLIGICYLYFNIYNENVKPEDKNNNNNNNNNNQQQNQGANMMM